MIDGLSETSSNFDLDGVKPFMDDLSKHIPSGFGQKEVDKVMEMIDGLEVKGGSEIEFKPTINGQQMRLIISVYMDDFDAPDIAFLSEPPMIQIIENVMDREY